MHASTLLVTLAAAVSASEIAIPGHQAVKRAVEARQTSGTGGDAACLTALMSVYSSLPTPPPELVSYALTATVTDPCNLSVPSSLSAPVSSYQQSVFSWLGQNGAAVSSALSQCPSFSSIAASAGANICTQPAAVGGGSSASTTSGSARPTGATGGSGTNGTNPSGTGNPPAATTPAKAGARENVVAYGMGALAFVGAVALL